MAACVGFAVLLSGCFGGDAAAAFVVTEEPTPEPVYEPAGSQGSNAFFSLEDQIEATNSATISLALAEAEAAGVDPQSAIAQISLTAPNEEELKSGLYGGTAENTCDPERLIRYLLDNPGQGQVWADVQGIKFADIPDFIRSLTPEVLEADLVVLNHGYDPKGHAIPIVSTLAAGSAVLVDDDGDVRTRCYCGNPILPYEEQDYQPPKCLVQFAVVYATPDDRRRIDGVPRSVKATNRTGTYENVSWTEVTWGGQTGWVRSNEAQTRYCKPVEKIDCVSSAQITQRPGSGEYIGEVNKGYVSVVAPNVDGWSLIKFAETSGWIEASSMGSSDCVYEIACISVSSGTYSRPGKAGVELLSAGRTQKVEYTGQSFINGSGAYRQVAVTYPGPTQIGYVADTDVTVLPDSDCEVSIRCSVFDVDVPVYQESDSADTYGVLWFAEVQILGESVNGRYEIDFGNGTGWVDIAYLQGAKCEQTVECVQAYGDGYEPLPDGNGTRTLPAGPFVATFSGKVAVVGGDTYREFTSPAAGAGNVWVETSAGYATLPWEDCQVDPPCNPETDICYVECYARGFGEGYEAEATWTPTSRQADITFSWPSAVNPLQPNNIGLQSSGIGATAIGQLSYSDVVSVSWFDPITGYSGSTQCELDPCDFLEESGVDPESCIRLDCSVEQIVNAIGIPTDVLTASWTPASAVINQLTFDWQFQNDVTLPNATSPSSSAQPTSGAMFANITYQGPNGQSGVVNCQYDDICSDFNVELVNESTSGCCPEGTGFAGEAKTCCPDGSRTRGGGCCPEGEVVSPTDQCEPKCTEVLLATGTCCVSSQVLNDAECCPDGTDVAGQECVPTCDGQVALNGECCPNERFLEVGECCPADSIADGRQCVPVDEPTPTPTVEAPTPTPIPDEEPPPPPPTPTPTPTVQAPPTPTPTVQAPPTPTPTPTPAECEYGVAANGQCKVLCQIGELNLQGLCFCPAGTRLQQQPINGCEIACPDGATNISPTECSGISCPAGQELFNGACTDINCPAGTQLQGGTCVTSSCPTGEELREGTCLPIVCSQGTLVGNECVVQQPQCESGYTFSDTGGCTTGNGCVQPRLDTYLNGVQTGECVAPSDCVDVTAPVRTALISGTGCFWNDVRGNAVTAGGGDTTFVFGDPDICNADGTCG